MSSAVDAVAPDDERVVANRYRIEQRLAKGGMGIVYRAFDPVHGRAIALKRLHTGDARSRQRRMFEREYATLVGLQHPRIIEVHEYGVDEHGAFYTMELLDGLDLRELSPLPASLACKYLRDVASSLGLLHARRLLHRDLSPRNVRITSDGRAKLIDFGGLASFGKHSTVVGTPPCVPPEALTGASLDQRADLYSLGALAYYLLTGRHAFEVRGLPDLVAALRNPIEPPSHVVKREPKEPIPAELDELVMALLSRDPMARPASAAEVIERLSAIAGLPVEREPRSATSYLLGGRTMGRARERARLRMSRKRALRGHGASVLIDAASGMGASRLMQDLALEAQLTGAITAFVDARTARGTLGVAHALLREIAIASPALAQLAIDDRAFLAPLLNAGTLESSRRVSASGSAHGSAHGDPREQRLREQRALVGFVERLTEQAPVLLCVRGIEQADESSVALLWALAQSATSRRLLIVVARDPMQTPLAPVLMRSFTQVCSCMELRGLGRGEVRALVETSFGPVPGTERMAEWLHRVSGGNPLGCLELLRHLIDTQRIRFSEGVWAMPSELSSSELPSALEQVIEARVDSLPDDARKLANALCVERGIAPPARCHAVAKLEGIADPGAAIEALLETQVIVLTARGYKFSHETMRVALAERLSATERRRLHRLLGSLLSDLSGGDPEILLDAGWHLLHGGDERRGADLLAQAGTAIAWDANAMPLAIPALRAALDVFRAQGRSPHELSRLLGPLAMAGYYTDRRIMEQYGDEALAVLLQITGVTRARALAPKVGAWLAIVIGLTMGAFGFLRGYKLAGLTRFRDAMVMLVTSCSMMAGLATMTLDAARGRKYASLLEPLLPLGRVAKLSHDLCLALSLIPEDRPADALEALRAVLEECRKPNAMPAGSQQIALSGALYALGSCEAICEDSRALDRAAELEAMGSHLFEMFANQVRTLHHSLRGEIDLARAYRARVEAHALQAGSSWQAEVWGPCSQILACELVRDLEEAKRVMEELDRLAAEIPSLRRHAALARSSYHKMRGDCVASVKWREDALKNNAARSFNGWPVMIAGHVLDCARTDQLERALTDGRAALALYTPRDQVATSLLTPLHVEVALAEAEAGELATARGRIESALATMGTRGGPATRGTLHEAAARIAIVAGDRELAKLHLREVEHCFRPTRNPVLIGRCERLRRAVGRKQRPVLNDAVRDTLDLGPPVGTQSATPASARPSALESAAPLELALEPASESTPQPLEERPSGMHERASSNSRTVPPPGRPGRGRS